MVGEAKGIAIITLSPGVCEKDKVPHIFFLFDHRLVGPKSYASFPTTIHPGSARSSDLSLNPYQNPGAESSSHIFLIMYALPSRFS